MEIEANEGRVTPESGAGTRKRTVVGYMEGRGGLETSSPDAAMAAWDAELSHSASLLGDLIEEAKQIELAMAEVRHLLRLSQPAMWDRYSVRWWVPYTGSRRLPVLVREQSGIKGRVKPVRVTTRGTKIRVDRGFSLNADLTKEAVDTYWLLWNMRESVVAELTRINKALSGDKQKRRGAVQNLAERMRDLQAEAQGRLTDVGLGDDIEDAEDEQSAGEAVEQCGAMSAAE